MPKRSSAERAKQYDKAIAEAKALFSRRNAEYGDSIIYGGVYGAAMELVGITGRLKEVFENFKTIPSKRRYAVIKDAILDAINYSVIMHAMLSEDNFWGEDLEPETFIYALEDPDTHTIRYIGKADKPKRRMKAHLLDHSDTFKARWLNKLKREGKLPELLILKSIPVSMWQDAEQWWIREARAAGFDLTNGTDGGEGLRSPSAETRLKMSKAKLGKKHSEAWKEKMRGRIPWSKGKHFSPELRKKISEAHKGYKWTDAQREKMKGRVPGNKGKGGYHLSAETRARMTLGQRARRKRESEK